MGVVFYFYCFIIFWMDIFFIEKKDRIAFGFFRKKRINEIFGVRGGVRKWYVIFILVFC